MTILITGAAALSAAMSALVGQYHDILAVLRQQIVGSILRQQVCAGRPGRGLQAVQGDLICPAWACRDLPARAIIHLGARLPGNWIGRPPSAPMWPQPGGGRAGPPHGSRLVFIGGFMLENHAHLHGWASPATIRTGGLAAGLSPGGRL